MKQLLLSLCFLLATTLNAEVKIVNIGVIPTPQSVVFSGDSASLDKVKFNSHKVPALQNVKNQQGAYIITISKKRFDIYYTDEEGLANATHTFDMMHLHFGNTIPCMTITDWPAFLNRGWLDDVSRGPVTKNSFSKEQFSRMSMWKMNFGSYYTEHTLHNPQYPDIIPPLDFNYCPNASMANLQCFAHFEKTLRIPYYKGIMDTRTNVNPASDNTYDFLRSQIANTWKLYPSSHHFNINCDETEGLGSGRAYGYVSQVGADTAYCRHIRKVYDIVVDEASKLGKEPPEVLMWGDIVGKNPDMIRHLPHEMNYIVWSYAAADSYDGMLEPFRGTKFWIAPGVSHWSSIPFVNNYIRNIANFARDGYKAGALGIINTSWDDSGEALFADTWHAMAWAAEMAWHPLSSNDPQEINMREKVFNEIYSELYGDVKPIYALGALADNKWVGEWFNTGALYQPLLNFHPSNIDDAVIVRCDSVEKIVTGILTMTDSLQLPHVVYGCHRILTVCAKNRLRVLLGRALVNHNVTPVRDFADAYFKMLHNLKCEYLRLWDNEATCYSREIICQRYDDLANEIAEAFHHVFIAKNSTEVTLSTIDTSLVIYYTLDGGKPSEGSAIYSSPLVVDHSCLIQAMTHDRWGEPYYSSQYTLSHLGMGHRTALNNHYSDYRPVYSGGGENALADGILGSDDSYADGHWQGFSGCDISVDYDFGKQVAVNNISFRSLQNTFDWILSPQTLDIQVSQDGITWTTARTEHFDPQLKVGGTIIHANAARNLDLTTRHLRVIIRNPGVLPSWHPAHGNDSYLFVDEIVIE
ncbi:MAG: chitobiase/beta-hexosaminidase C-terminal domain-containing protein [Paludibacteraceae bacterium]|nr:chitobiase/beta-hexosaminidase C-terminal domain-containing protein [Paludibacteraceae bacterium]